jgi:hypothetical protein
MCVLVVFALLLSYSMNYLSIYQRYFAFSRTRLLSSEGWRYENMIIPRLCFPMFERSHRIRPASLLNEEIFPILTPQHAS